jgi:hypothetical protein
MRTVFAGLTAVIIVLSLGACAAEEKNSQYPDITLAQAKSNVQLLRNDAAGRIPEELVDIILVSSDLSTGCESEASDPDGLIRAWQSGARISLIPGADLTAVIDDLVASFVDQGWEHDSGSASTITLSKSTIFTDIEITTTPEDADAGKSAEVTLALTSPCVVTDGEGSKEVRQLEAMAF